MTTGIGPYVVPTATDTDDTGGVPSMLETTFTASEQLVDIDGSGTLVHAEVFNGAIPGPTLRLNVGDTVVVRLVNDLPHPTGIHWHGIELANYVDGTEATQDGAPAAPLQTLGNGVPAGGTFLYKFTVTRPGLFWYHPHHHNSLNRLFRGMYGMIVVTDPAEAAIVGSVLPPASETLQLVLSDTTVCRAPGTNLAATYVDPTTLPLADRAEWLSLLNAQTGPSPRDLCEIAPTGSATDDDGNPAAVSYAATFSPSGRRPAASPRSVEGQTVLTNGMNVGARLGTPAAPGALVSPPGTPPPRGVLSGQGLRLQILNCCVHRYFRLRLTTGTGTQVPIVRVGGEGGLLDNALLEGGTIGTLVTNYDAGEILLPPAVRADVVVAIPAGLPVGSVLTLWTRDYQRVGNTNPNNWSQIPTVPVMHLTVTGSGPTYTITGGNYNAPATGTALRGPAGMLPVEDLSSLATTALLPGPALPARPAGFVNSDITMNTSGGVPNVDTIPGMIMGSPTFMQAPHLGSSRYAEQNRVIQLTVTNTTPAHHPFHLHGFSFQLISVAPRVGAPVGTTGSYTWAFREFRDTIDIPRHHTLTFRVRTDPRPLVDGVTAGGAFGRWMFHCHIFFHHEKGMMSEFVVTSAAGDEKPTIFVGGSWAYTAIPGLATRSGRFHHPQGLTVTSLTATLANGTPIGSITPAAPGVNTGTWNWSYTAPAADTPRTEYVYVTATDSGGRKDQCVFRLQIGGADNGSDVGDPHIRTVDGVRYDFQAAGEFTLLRDREAGMEIQVRQTPVETPPPITDDYSGLTCCVSLNTAIAARMGSHRIAFQPSQQGEYRFFLDGRPTLLTREGIDLGGDRVSTLDGGTEPGLRIDFEQGTVLLVTPRLWTSYGIRYLDVSVSKTQASEGIMGRIPKGTWLPALPSGATVGPKPAALLDRYVALYRTFANAWRVTSVTSLFEYVLGTSTATFTDVDWPAPPGTGTPTCKLKPQFQKPLKPILQNISIAEAERICGGVTLADLHKSCVFDVAATGDPAFAQGYVVAQNLRLNSTTVQLTRNKGHTHTGETLVVTAIVAPLTAGRPMPRGTVTFLIDNAVVSQPVSLDGEGRASFSTSTLKIGEYKIRANYNPTEPYQASSSANLLHTVAAPHVSGTQTTGTPGAAGTPGTSAPGTGTTRSPSLGDLFKLCIPALAARIRKCLDQIAPCSCGGDHSQADHPAPEQPPTNGGGTGGGTPPGTGGHGH